MIRRTAVLAAVAMLAAGAAHAEERVLKAVSAFTEGSFQSVTFEKFIDKVNEDGKGLIRINYIGGPKAIPPFEVANAVRGGVVDIGNLTGAFYSKLMPEADALKLAEMPIAEQRKNGAWAYINQVHNQKLNAWYLGRSIDNLAFHLYLNKPIAKPDLTGLRLRVTPIYRDFFAGMGATVMQTAPGEVYTALERGVVDGYGWPITGIFDLGWQERTKYRVEPGFYRVDVNVLVNLDTWKKLSDAERAILEKAAAHMEELTLQLPAAGEAEAKRQAEAGIQVITLGGDDAKLWQRRATELGWEAVIKQSPEHGPKLKALLSR